MKTKIKITVANLSFIFQPVAIDKHFHYPKRNLPLVFFSSLFEFLKAKTEVYNKTSYSYTIYHVHLLKGPRNG